MKNKYLIFLVFIVLLYITACAPAQQAPANSPKPGAGANQPSTQPVISQPTDGSGVSDEVKQILDKSKSRVKSVYYKYKGPETGDNFYDFYVKGAKIKYLPYRELKALDRPESYNSVYIDKTAETSQTYCDDWTCIYKGKKADLNYNDAYISTILDWVDGVTKAAKVGEEVIDDRNVWKIDTNKGTLWVDTFYGIPLKIESSSKIYRFQQIAVNSVEDADIMPS